MKYKGLVLRINKKHSHQYAKKRTASKEADPIATRLRQAVWKLDSKPSLKAGIDW